MTQISIAKPSEKQKQFLRATEKYVGFGGARGGGKSWAVRTKAKLLAAAYPGIRLLIVRRSYPELTNNHIRILRRELAGMARYSDKEKLLRFPNGSVLQFTYCAKDSDLDRLQGVEFDVIFLDEATQLSEFQMRSITACLRGVNDFPKRVYFTCNPGGQGHGYIKRLFIDRSFQPGEDPRDYTFIQSLVTDNPVLLKYQPDYIRQLEALPQQLRMAWLEGRWDFCQGQFFEDFRQEPSLEAVEKTGLSPGELKRQRRFCHVISAFTPPEDWVVYRSYDWGYGKPFSFGWWAVDGQGSSIGFWSFTAAPRPPTRGFAGRWSGRWRRPPGWSGSIPGSRGGGFTASPTPPSGTAAEARASPTPPWPWGCSSLPGSTTGSPAGCSCTTGSPLTKTATRGSMSLKTARPLSEPFPCCASTPTGRRIWIRKGRIMWPTRAGISAWQGPSGRCGRRQSSPSTPTP